MAVSLLKMHQIFMLAFAWLRVQGKVAQMLVVSQPPPWPSWCFSCRSKAPCPMLHAPRYFPPFALEYSKEMG